MIDILKTTRRISLVIAAVGAFHLGITIASIDIQHFAYIRLRHSTRPTIESGNDTNEDQPIWLKVNGTPIDYPVAEEAGEPRGYYLSHSYWGEPSMVGSLYLDERSPYKGPHFVIYGHRVGHSGLMFSSLGDMFNQDEFDALGNAILTIAPFGSIEFLPLCAARVSEDNSSVLRFRFSDPCDLPRYADALSRKAGARSHYWEDQSEHASLLLTLITCSDTSGASDSRTIVTFSTDMNPAWI